MERLERLTVQVEAGFNALKEGSDSYFRLALVLFDSAAELLMYRRTEWLIAHERWKVDRLASLDAIAARNPDMSAILLKDREELRASTLSRGRIRDIERNFAAKAEYLADNGELDPGLVRVLKKLHQYRNEIYHRDELREATLRTCAELYALVVAGLMENLTPAWIGHPSKMPPALIPYLGADQGIAADFDAQAEVARQLIAQSDVGTWEEIPKLLSEHAESRVDGLLDDLTFCLELLDEWDDASLLHMVQVDGPEGFRLTPEAARERDVPVTMSVLETWRQQARDLGSLTDPIAGFSTFADFEDAFEPIEGKVRDLARAVDDEIQLRIDIARGK